MVKSLELISHHKIGYEDNEDLTKPNKSKRITLFSLTYMAYAAMISMALKLIIYHLLSKDRK